MVTCMSSNIARPLTLHTSPTDYSTFTLFNIRLLLKREKQQKVFTIFIFWLSLLSKGRFLQKYQMWLDSKFIFTYYIQRRLKGLIAFMTKRISLLWVI